MLLGLLTIVFISFFFSPSTNAEEHPEVYSSNKVLTEDN